MSTLLYSFAAALIVGGGIIAYAYLIEPFFIRTTRKEIVYPDLPPHLEGLTICHLSDMHSVKCGTFESILGNALAQTEADICVITGDTISSRAGLDGLPIVFGRFRPRLGTFAVLGNGDYKPGVPITQIADEFGKVGVRLLINESAAVPLEVGSLLHIIGVDDPHRQRDDLERAESGITDDGFRILLAHSPDILVKVKETSANLILAGHTHGGQIRFPFVGALWLHCHHGLGIANGYFGPGMLAGILGRELPHTHLYVSRGLGGSSVRARLMCPPELVLITLRGPKPVDAG